MNKNRSLTFSILLLAFLFVLAPSTVLAGNDASARMRNYVNSWVASVEKRVAKTIDHYCQLFDRYQERYGTNIPEFCAEPENSPVPSPTPTPSPTPIPTPTPSPTPSPTPTPTPSPSPSPSPSPTPTPTPSPTGSLLISEVYYDVDAAHGSEIANEWVEIYNNAPADRNISGYKIVDATSTDVLPEGTIIPANSYLVVIADSSTNTFWTIPATANVATIGATVGNGLGNSADAVHLKDAADAVIDSVSWGSNVSAFDPSVPIVAGGSSIARTNPAVDTDTAGDWTELTAPTPGE